MNIETCLGEECEGLEEPWDEDLTWIKGVDGSLLLGVMSEQSFQVKWDRKEHPRPL